jgi:NTE family protein
LSQHELGATGIFRGEEPHAPVGSFFDDMDLETRRALMAELEWFSLPGGTVLFEKKEPSDAFYVVLAGSLGALVGGDSPDQAGWVHRVDAGETVGEIGMITGHPRSATVIALRDTSLLRITKPAFETLVRVAPRTMLRLLAQLAHWLQRPHSSARTPFVPKTLAVVPLGTSEAVAPARALADALAAMGKRVILACAEMSGLTEDGFHALEAAHDFAVYEADVANPAWTRLCMRRADRVLLVASADAAPPPDLSVIDAAGRFSLRAFDLLLMQDADRRLPSAARPWLRNLAVGFHHHARRGSKSDMARLARCLIGRAVGIALSGGGARGFGHIGVIKALRERGVPMDLVGGTSMGAIIGAGIALEWGDSELRARVYDAFVRSDPLRDFGLPFVALTRGRRVERGLRKHFGDAHAEDLWRPYFAVASNLTTGGVLVQQEGELWRALKASVAIPGLLPPQIEAGQVLVDGTMMNNLPTDVLSALRRGPVIGVDVARYNTLSPVSREEQGVIRRWLLPRDQRNAPGIANLLLRSATVSSEAQTKISRGYSDVLLEPPMQDIDMRDWRALDRAVDAGYRYTAKRLQDSDDDLSRLSP